MTEISEKGVSLAVGFCTECGQALDVDWKFCDSCGRPTTAAIRSRRSDDAVTEVSGSADSETEPSSDLPRAGLFQNFGNVVFNQYATFSGRASRREFWLFELVAWSIIGVLWMTAIVLFSSTGSTDPNSGLAIAGLVSFVSASVIGLLLVPPHIAITIRRLNDAGRSRWLILASIVPLGWIVLVMVLAERAPEDRLQRRKVNLGVIVGILLVALLVGVSLVAITSSDDPSPVASSPAVTRLPFSAPEPVATTTSIDNRSPEMIVKAERQEQYAYYEEGLLVKCQSFYRSRFVDQGIDPSEQSCRDGMCLTFTPPSGAIGIASQYCGYNLDPFKDEMVYSVPVSTEMTARIWDCGLELWLEGGGYDPDSAYIEDPASAKIEAGQCA